MIEVASQLARLFAQEIATGAINDMVASGLVLNCKATEVLNFGRGDIVMLSAFLAGLGYAQQQQLGFTDCASLLQRAELLSMFRAEVELANMRLPEAHRVRDLHIIPRSLRSGDEELTSALRLNRRVVLARYPAPDSGGTPPRFTQLQTGGHS